MTFARKMTLATLFLMGACFGAAAQDRALKFTLTDEVHVGGATLAPGEYQMTLYNDSYPVALITPKDRHGSSVIAVASTSDSGRGCKTSSLTLTPRDGAMNLRSACFADSDMVLYFPVAAHRKQLAALPATTLAGAQ